MEDVGRRLRFSTIRKESHPESASPESNRNECFRAAPQHVRPRTTYLEFRTSTERLAAVNLRGNLSVRATGLNGFANGKLQRKRQRTSLGGRALAACRQPVGDCCRSLNRCLHGVPRHQHRQRGSALHGRQSWRQQRREHLDPHRLPGLERDRAAPQWMVCRLPGAQAFLSDLSWGLHPEFAVMRARSESWRDHSVSNPARRRRWRPAAHVTSNSGGHVSAPTARAGVRHFRDSGRGGAYHWTYPRGVDHRQLLLALDLLY